MTARQGRDFFWIYILELANGSYYTGYARDLVRRYQAHSSGRGARLTRSFPPVALRACWKLYSCRAAAMRTEAWIKGRSRREKQSLIDDPAALPGKLLRCGREEPVEAVIPPPLIPSQL